MPSRSTTYDLGTALIDNFTVEGALYTIAHHHSRLLDGFPSPPESILDFVCLAAFVEALVVHERVLFVAKYSPGWKRMITSEQRRSLRGILSPLRLSDAVLSETDTVAQKRSRAVQINRWQPVFPYRKGFPDSLELKLRMAALLATTRYEGMYTFDIECGNSPWVDQFDRQMISYESQNKILASGAYFYEALSRRLQRPCIPHVLRVPYYTIAYLETTGRIESAPAIALEVLERAIEPISSSMRSRFNDPFYDIRIPAVLAAIIKDCDDPSDILPAALDLRSTRSAIAFRRHLALYDAGVVHGDKAVLLELLKQTQDIADKFSEEIGSSPREIPLQVGIAPLTANIKLPLPSSLLKRWRRRRSHVAFLHFLYTSMMSIKNLSIEIKRIWGEDVDPAVSRLLQDARHMDLLSNTYKASRCQE